MDFRQMFDRNTTTQFSLLLYLVDRPYPVEKNKITADLQFSSFILEKAIEEINDITDSLDVAMHIDTLSQVDAVKLVGAHWEKIETVYHYFVKNSLGYKFLSYLYQNRSYNIVDVQRLLAISEASVYRQITSLNKLMAEFHIEIKHGQLNGDNLQLAHFFFQVFWNSMSLVEMEQHFTDPEIIRFLDFLEIKFDRPFTQSARMRISLWCRILKFSTTKNVPISKPTMQLAEEFQADPFYCKVKECYFYSLSYSAVFGSDYKAAAIYTFLSTGFYLRPSAEAFVSPSGCPTYASQVQALNEKIYDKIRELLQLPPLEVNKMPHDYWKYLLTQLHTGVLYLKGIVTEYDSHRFLANLLPDLLHVVNEPMLDELVNTTEAFTGQTYTGVNRQYIAWIYSYTIDRIRKVCAVPLKFGVHLLKTPLLTVVYLENLRNAYSNRPYIHIEAAAANTMYDVLISDSPAVKKDFKFQAFFCTQDIGQDYTLPLREVSLHG